MTIDFNALVGTALHAGLALRSDLPSAVATILAAKDTRVLRQRLARRTTALTMLAGSGSRWVASLLAARQAMASPASTAALLRQLPADRLAYIRNTDPAEPRGLFPVRNALGFGPHPLPIAAYALAALRGLGSPVIIVRGWEDAITERILQPLGFASDSWIFRTQQIRDGKPRGHADAAFQAMDVWSKRDYVIVNFGGDASSPLTAFAGLAVLEVLCSTLGDAAPGLLLPVAFDHAPAYPIAVDDQGLPLSFGHDKLGAGRIGGTPGKTDHLDQSRPPAVSMAGRGAYTNVGVRIYRSAALAEAIVALRKDYWTPGSGYAIPGNDQASAEFALDNVDAWLANQGKVRLLHVARAQELSPVKALDDVPRFERDIGVVCGDWTIDL